jgi:hypothetical protein
VCLGVKRQCTIFQTRVGPVRIPQKAHRNTLHRTCIFASVGSTGHVVRSDASGARNVDALFFIPDWASHESHKKHTRTCYAEFVFLHPVASTTYSAFWCIRGAKRRGTIFRARVGLARISQKLRRDMLHRTCVFAHGRIFGSRSVF